MDKNQSSSVLKCVRECVIPDVGTFAVGDVVTDPAVIAKIGKDHPNFTGTNAEEK